MVNYGTADKFLLNIANVDFEPEICGVKLSQFPSIVCFSSIPLWFGSLGIAVIALFSLISFSLFVSRREMEGRPITLNSKLIEFISKLPMFIRSGLFPSIACVIPYSKKYRR